MAGPYFVRSGAAGAGTGADWTNAFTTLTACIAGGLIAGDTVWVADDHAETTAGAVTLTFPGTVASPNFIYCVDHTKASPGTGDLLTTATVASSGANAMTIQGSIYCYGITFQAGTGATTVALTLCNTSGQQVYSACSLQKLGTTASASALTFGAATVSCPVTMVNTTVKFGSTTDGIRLLGDLNWRNTASAISGATIPNVLFQNAQGPGRAIIEDVDLSAIVNTKTLVADNSSHRAFYFINCTFAAGVTVAAASATAGQQVYVINSDSGATNYRSEKYQYRGTETTETTIVRTGGASDGTTPQSRKIATTANSLFVMPFEAMPIVIWIDSTGSKTITVHAVSGAAGLLNNDDVWITADYLGSAATPQGSLVTSAKANNLATGVAYSASGAAWAGSPSGTPFSMAVTFTMAMKGLVYVYVRAAKASMTVYIDPKVVVS